MLNFIKLRLKNKEMTSKISIRTKANRPLWDKNRITLPFESS